MIKFIKTLYNLNKYVKKISKYITIFDEQKRQLNYDVGRVMREHSDLYLEKLQKVELLISKPESEFTKILSEHLKQFEEKIQNMAHAYTANLDDVKSDYLKRYLEIRLKSLVDEVALRMPDEINRLRVAVEWHGDSIREIRDKLEAHDDSKHLE
jgi:hypothetical protein